MQDLLEMSTDDVRMCAMMRNFPRMAQAFIDVGVPVVHGRCSIIGQKAQLRSAIATALPRNGADRLIHVVTSLACMSPTCAHGLL